MQVANHILSLEGILTTFQIAKKVTAKDVKKLRDKMKSAGVDAAKLQEIIKQSVLNEAEQCIKTHQIPGLIIETTPPSHSEEEKRIVELTYFASLISKKVSERKISKYHCCYIINAIVNMLGLTDNDFEEFHRKFGKFKNGQDPNSDTPDYA